MKSKYPYFLAVNHPGFDFHFTNQEITLVARVESYDRIVYLKEVQTGRLITNHLSIYNEDSIKEDFKCQEITEQEAALI